MQRRQALCLAFRAFLRRGWVDAMHWFQLVGAALFGPRFQSCFKIGQAGVKLLYPFAATDE